jgi:hypothetical protein
VAQNVWQLPALQDVPKGHKWPHCPQLASFDVTSTHVPEQLMRPPPQPVDVQKPALQVCPARQAFPQAPQLFTSVEVFVHDPAHRVCPAPQALEQTPALQVGAQARQPGGVVQVLPHPPQLKMSVVTSTHVPEHKAKPAWQALPVQTPPLQVCPGLQAFPQAPQFAFVSTAIWGPTLRVPFACTFTPWVRRTA